MIRLSKDEIEEQNVRLADAITPHKVEIYVKCRDLADLDFTDKSDPYAVMYLRAEKDTKWNKVGETEKVMNSLDPNFTKPFSVNYMFERNQLIRIEVYDYDDVTDHDLIGSFECYLNKLLTNKSQMLTDTLTFPN